MNNQSALWLYARVKQHKKITLCYFDVTNSYSKNLFSPALIYIFPRVSSWPEQSSQKLVSHLKDIMEDSFANQNISTK